MAFNYTESVEWEREVIRERQSLICSKRTPVEMLVALFKLYEDDFDVNHLEQTLPELYSILKTFCNTPPVSYDEIIISSVPLVKYFYEHQETVRSTDVILFYAILNFIDMLKQKHIYFQIINY